MIAIWTNGTAIAAGTAYAVPADAGLPPNAYITGVRSVIVAPLAGSTTAPVQEVYTSGTPAAGEVGLSVANQQLTSGDAIPASTLVVANLILSGE